MNLLFTCVACGWSFGWMGGIWKWHLICFYICSTPQDFGANGGGQWAVRIHSCVSSPRLPAARCPMAQHSWTTGGFLGWTSSPGTKLHHVQLPYSEPAIKCGTRSTVHLQYFQPTRPRSVDPVHGGHPSPTVWTSGPVICIATYHCVSGGQSPPFGRDIDIYSSRS